MDINVIHFLDDFCVCQHLAINKFRDLSQNRKLRTGYNDILIINYLEDCFVRGTVRIQLNVVISTFCVSQHSIK